MTTAVKKGLGANLACGGGAFKPYGASHGEGSGEGSYVINARPLTNLWLIEMGKVSSER